MNAPTTDRSLRPVELKRKAVEHYRPLVGDELVAEIRGLALELRGARILELSSTATGGGVAELLASLVPLEVDLGLAAEWRVIAGDPRFFNTTKRIHNGMQGMEIELGAEEREEYLSHNQANAQALAAGEWDVVIVHDPQPVAIRSFLPAATGRWLWRCHIDSSSPYLSVWEFLRPYVETHEMAAFTLDSFIPPDIGIPTATLIPAIDPLTSKNRVLPDYLAAQTVSDFGVDLTRPLMLQVSRFDPWKNPLGVVEAWRLARQTFPELQLALVGSMARDDPEGWLIYDQLRAETTGEPDCFLFTNHMGVSHHEVNAFQRSADVAVQMSSREGFGLVVSETLWKATPMVAGRAGGIPIQLEDGVSGRLAGPPAEVASAVVSLLEAPDEAGQLGAAGAARVRERFLMPRLLRDQLKLLRDLLASS